MPIANGADGDDVEGVAERVGDHDGARARRDRRFDRGRLDVVCGDLRVDEHRHHVGLEDRIDRRGEAGGAGDDFIARPQLARLEPRRGERHERHEIRRGAGVDGERVFHADALGQLGLELRVETAGRQPEIQRRIDQHPHVARVEHAARDGNVRFRGIERRAPMRGGVIAVDEIENGRAQRLRIGRRICQHLECPQGVASRRVDVQGSRHTQSPLRAMKGRSELRASCVAETRRRRRTLGQRGGEGALQTARARRS